MVVPNISRDEPVEKYETGVGEVRTVALSDGSSVSIDAKTNLGVAFEARDRVVRMQGGRALFRVTHDVSRPFRVVVGNVTVTDIGTAFQVVSETTGGSVEVLVTEGAVLVDFPSGRMKLVAGERGHFEQSVVKSSKAQTSQVPKADIDRAISWREGWIELEGETLSSAVYRFNRYSRIPIRIGKPGLGNERLYGSFRSDDASGFARASAASLGTNVTVGPNEIVIGLTKN
jgi:transmembrane sensor